VVGIIKRNSWRERGFCGAVNPPKRLPPPERTASVLVVPVDRRFPKIRIQTSQVGGGISVYVRRAAVQQGPDPIRRSSAAAQQAWAYCGPPCC
jgi:hypothetical protein